MNKILGIGALVLVVVVVAIFATWQDGESKFLTAYNLNNLLQRIGRFGILSLAAAFVIVIGGIDLSIGAVVCVAGCVLPWLLRDQGWPEWLALATVVGGCGVIGAWHGLLIVGLRLQPFVVTLCGLLIYRGVMRYFTGDQSMGGGTAGEGLRWLATGSLPLPGFRVPVVLLVLSALAAATWLLWSRTVWGRHLFALGRNEEAARHCGVATGRLSVLAYVACAALAGFGGCLAMLDVNSVQASTFGSFYELYAIAGAVLGGVALRGGEGSVVGLVLGVALMQLLSNLINLCAADNQLEFVVVGAVILLGAAADEGLRRWWRRNRRT